MDVNKLKDLLAKLKYDKKLIILLMMLIVGIILIVLSSVFEEESDFSEKETQSLFNEKEYVSQLESKLENMVALINGAGDAKVIVTLECDYETVYARDASVSIDDKSTDEDSEYIIIDTEQTQSGLLLKTVTPKVRGVAVLCTGGDLTYVKSAIVDMMVAVLDVGSNHISVAKIK